MVTVQLIRRTMRCGTAKKQQYISILGGSTLGAWSLNLLGDHVHLKLPHPVCIRCVCASAGRAHKQVKGFSCIAQLLWMNQLGVLCVISGGGVLGKAMRSSPLP